MRRHRASRRPAPGGPASSSGASCHTCSQGPPRVARPRRTAERSGSRSSRRQVPRTRERGRQLRLAGPRTDSMVDELGLGDSRVNQPGRSMPPPADVGCARARTALPDARSAARLDDRWPSRSRPFAAPTVPRSRWRHHPATICWVMLCSPPTSVRRDGAAGTPTTSRPLDALDLLAHALEDLPSWVRRHGDHRAVVGDGSG